MKIEEVPAEDNLYVIKTYTSSGTLIKLGYSSRIRSRLRTYLNYNPGIELIGTYYREDARQFEEWFHSNHKSSFRKEWYKDEEVIIKSIQEVPLLDSRPQRVRASSKNYGGTLI